MQRSYDDPGEYQPMIDAAAVANEIERIIKLPGDNVVTMPPRREQSLSH